MIKTTQKKTLYDHPDPVYYDNYSFELVAKILYEINPAAKDKFINEVALQDWMKTETMVTLDGAGYWGTLGFLISVCRSADKKSWYATASITPYMVKSYADMMKTYVDTLKK